MKIRKGDNVFVISGKDTKQKIIEDTKTDDGKTISSEKKIRKPKT
jgi:ribosomal protein L24